jgi:histidine triad (HIT) family protein
MCIFCKIIDGNIPSSKVYEDENILAILDLSQTTYGHTLVMPKKHYQNILEIPSDELATLMVKVQELAKLITAKLNANGVNILVNTNEAAGQTVMHLHIHIIPRYDENDGISIDFKPNENANLSDVLNDINK